MLVPLLIVGLAGLLGADETAPPTASPGPDPASALLGTWAAARTFGPALRGPIEVRDPVAPRAALGGFVARGAADGGGGGLVFRFPGDRGELRLPARLRGARIDAMWVQPTMLTGGARYASPVALAAVVPGVWRGRVAPLDDQVRMTLHVVRGADGRVGAFLRDPLFNAGRRLRTMSVAVDGRRVTFTPSSAAPAAPMLVAPLTGDDALTLTLPPAAGLPPLAFVRRAGAGDPPSNFAYRRPQATGDGWAIASASEVGIAPAALVALARFAAGSAPTGVTSPDVHAVAIARHGKLIFDDYFAGFDDATPHDTRSAGKTYADMLVGAAILAGTPIRDDTPLLRLFPQETGLANPDPRKARITVGDALSMSTGLDCDDDDDTSAANESTMQAQTRQPDWYRFMLDTRMVRDPGTKAVYCSASINLAGGAVAGAARAWLPAFFAQHVAVPLQMQRYALNLTPTGQMYLGGGAYVRPRDFLKIGQVFLDGGTWHGRRIVPRDWVARSWTARRALGPGDGYGYAWHVRAFAAGARTYRDYEAQGNGGQVLAVFPQLDLAVMMMQGNYQNFTTWGATRDAILRRVIAAVEHP